MSQGHRDDTCNTEAEMRKPSGSVNGKNWLRHSGQAEKIDAMLLDGATVREISQELVRLGLCKKDVATAIRRVRNHLYHLGKGAHNVPLICVRNDIWRFAAQRRDD